jgi:hypothetical protein
MTSHKPRESAGLSRNSTTSRSINSGHHGTRTDARKEDPKIDMETERAKKLADMQEAAAELDLNREKRLAALADKEKEEHMVEEEARMKSSKDGSKGDFVNRLNRKAGDLDLAERVRRGKGGMQREQEIY